MVEPFNFRKEIPFQKNIKRSFSPFNYIVSSHKKIKLDEDSPNKKLERYITKGKNVLYELPTSNINTDTSFCFLNNKSIHNNNCFNFDKLKLGFDLLNHKINKLNDFSKEKLKKKDSKNYSPINLRSINLNDSINTNYILTSPLKKYDYLSNKNYLSSAKKDSKYRNISNKYINPNINKYYSSKSKNNYNNDNNSKILNNNYLTVSDSGNNFDKYIIGNQYKPQIYPLSPYETHYFHNYQNIGNLNRNDFDNNINDLKKDNESLPQSSIYLTKRKNEDNVYNNLGSLLNKRLDNTFENKYYDKNEQLNLMNYNDNYKSYNLNNEEYDNIQPRFKTFPKDYMNEYPIYTVNDLNEKNIDYSNQDYELQKMNFESDENNFRENMNKINYKNINEMNRLNNKFYNNQYINEINDLNNEENEEYNDNEINDLNNLDNNYDGEMNEIYKKGNPNLNFNENLISNFQNEKIRGGRFQPKVNLPPKINEDEINEREFFEPDDLLSSGRNNIPSFNRNIHNNYENINEINDEKLFNNNYGNIQQNQKYIKNQNMPLTYDNMNNRIIDKQIDDEKINLLQERIMNDEDENNNYYEENLNSNNNYERGMNDRNNQYEEYNDNYYEENLNSNNNYERGMNNENDNEENLNSNNNYERFMNNENNNYEEYNDYNYEENTNRNYHYEDNKNNYNYNYQNRDNYNNNNNKNNYNYNYQNRDNNNNNNNKNNYNYNYQNRDNYNNNNNINNNNQNFDNNYENNDIYNEELIKSEMPFKKNINNNNIETKSIGIGMTPREQLIEKTNELNIINIKNPNLNKNEKNFEMEQGNYERKLSKENIKDGDKNETNKQNVLIIKDGEKQIIQKRKIPIPKKNIMNNLTPNKHSFENENSENYLIEEEVLNNNNNIDFGNNINNENIKNQRIISTLNHENFNEEEKNLEDKNKIINEKKEEKKEENKNNIEKENGNVIKQKEENQSYIGKIHDFFNESFEGKEERNKSENDIYISEEREEDENQINEEEENENENENEKEDEKEEMKKQNEDEDENEEILNQIKQKIIEDNKKNNNENNGENINKNNTEDNKNNKINEEEQITQLSIFDSNGKENEFSPKIGDYMQNIKKVNKLKSVLLNSNNVDLESISSGIKGRIESYNKDDDKEIELNDKTSFNTLSKISDKMIDKSKVDFTNIQGKKIDGSKDDFINIQGKKIDGLSKKNKIYKKKNKNKKGNFKKNEKHLCYKFITNPQRFFTEDLCDNVLKAYDLDINKTIKRMNSATPSQKLIYNKKTVKRNNKINKNKIPLPNKNSNINTIINNNINNN